MTFREETVSSEMIYEGAILNLRRDLVTVRDGGTAYREIVEHNGGAAVVAITDEGKVVMVKQFRKAPERDVLEIPAGKIEKGEDPELTVKRELREETGYTAKKVRLMTEFLPSVGYTAETLYLYLATGLEPGETEFDPQEALDIIEYPLDDVVQMILEGKIRDGKTIAGILLTKHFL